MVRYLTTCNLPSFPTASQKVLGSGMVRGFPRNLSQLPNEIFWEADFDALEAPRFGASQLPNFPPPKGGAGFWEAPPFKGRPLQKREGLQVKKQTRNQKKNVSKKYAKNHNSLSGCKLNTTTTTRSYTHERTNQTTH